MTYIDLVAWVNESLDKIKGARIVNVYYTGKYWLMKIHRDGKKYLVLEPSHRINLTTIEPQRKYIDKLTAFLRKHVNGGFIRELNIVDRERIASIDIEKGNRKYIVYLELIPRGFLVITDNDNRILYASRFAEMRDRKIKIGEKYALPPGNIDILNTPSDKLLELMKKGKDLVRGLVKGWKIPGEIAEEILYRAGLYELKFVDVSSISRNDVSKLVNTLRDLINEAKRGKGYIILSNEDYFSFTPYYPRVFQEIHGLGIKELESFNTAIEAYFAFIEKVNEYERLKKEIEAELEKLDKVINEQKQAIERYKELSSKYMDLANYISLNINEVENILDCVKKMKDKYGWDKIVECKGVVNYNKNKGIIEIMLDNKAIELDIRLTAWDNARKYYKLSGEYKAKAERAKEALQELLRKKNELMSKTIEVARKEVIMLRPRMWFERYHWLITSEGYLVLAGRDASQNESLVRKHLEPTDIFLHADIHGAPATIIKTRGRVPSEKSILEAAVIAACYSKAWKLGLASIDVFWVRGEQVSKTPPSGEYITKGAFMIYGKKNYLKNVELKLAVGIEPICDDVYGFYERVIVGPEDLVMKRSLVYAVIVSGSREAKTVAKKMIDEFKKAVTNIPISIDAREIEERIPGKSDIIKINKGLVKEEEIECIRD